MHVDTDSMRQVVNAAPGNRMAMTKIEFVALINAAPGEHVAVEKDQIHGLLGAVDLGRVADELAGMSQRVRELAIAA